MQPYQVQESQINKDNAKLWNGANNANIPPSLYKLSRYEPGKSPSPVTDKHDAAVRMLYPALDHPTNPLSVVPNCLADEVLMDAFGRATGVKFTQQSPPELRKNTVDDPCGLQIAPGNQAVIFAKNVILAAGTLGSTRLLLKTAGANHQLENDNIGRGVVIHPSLPIIGLFEERVDMFSGACSLPG